MSRRVLVMILAMALAGGAARAQSIVELRSSARVEPGAAVTLSQVANLTGDDATALAYVEVLNERPAQAGVPKITLDDVRRALSERAKVNWGRVTLRGSSCTLVAPTAAARPTHVPAPLPSAGPEDPHSVRKAVADRIGRLVQAEPADLRLTFNAEDDEILKLSVKGRTLEIKPTAASDKLPLALTLYEGERIVASRSIRVGVLVRRTVAVAAAAKSRGEAIESADVSTDQQWVGPNLKPAAPEAVIGSAAQGRIATGQIITITDVAPAVIVNKGDQVAVSCVSGTVVVTTKARAMSAGRTGEVIKFQGLEDKRTFFARMSGRGRAVVAAAPDPTVHQAPEAMP